MFEGQAARHINTVGDEYVITVNHIHGVDVYKRGKQQKVKTLDIEYMRCSLVHGNFIFIGTEEKMLYLVDATNFTILDKMMTQSFVFTIALIDDHTIILGQYQGYVDIIKIQRGSDLVKAAQMRPFNSNVYKIVKTEHPNQLAFGCGNGLFFAGFDY